MFKLSWKFNTVDYQTAILTLLETDNQQTRWSISTEPYEILKYVFLKFLKGIDDCYMKTKYNPSAAWNLNRDSAHQVSTSAVEVAVDLNKKYYSAIFTCEPDLFLLRKETFQQESL